MAEHEDLLREARSQLGRQGARARWDKTTPEYRRAVGHGLVQARLEKRRAAAEVDEEPEGVAA